MTNEEEKEKKKKKEPVKIEPDSELIRYAYATDEREGLKKKAYMDTQNLLSRKKMSHIYFYSLKYHEARMERDKEIYERQIKIVDAQIDRLVYELYWLTEDEVKVVEGHSK